MTGHGLTCPWFRIPEALAAGGALRAWTRDGPVDYPLAEDAPAGAIVGLDPATGTLRRVTATNTRRTRT